MVGVFFLPFFLSLIYIFQILMMGLLCMIFGGYIYSNRLQHKFCSLDPLLPWTGYLISLSLSFITCKMGIIKVPTSQEFYENYMVGI